MSEFFCSAPHFAKMSTLKVIEDGSKVNASKAAEMSDTMKEETEYYIFTLIIGLWMCYVRKS